MHYSEIEALPPEAFLDPSRFVSGFDRKETGTDQYLTGLETGLDWRIIQINYRGVWGASDRRDGSGGSLTSYEGIGYHANTSALLQGFLDSPAMVTVGRWFKDQPITSTVIKEASNSLPPARNYPMNPQQLLRYGRIIARINALV